MPLAALVFDAASDGLDVLHFFPGWASLCPRQAPSLREQFDGPLFCQFRFWLRRLSAVVEAGRLRYRRLHAVAPDGSRFEAEIVVTWFPPADGAERRPTLMSLECVRRPAGARQRQACSGELSCGAGRQAFATNSGSDGGPSLAGRSEEEGSEELEAVERSVPPVAPDPGGAPRRFWSS
mmetsp:Transcript_54675/g.158805  ORF Transcript_54675/g.158805 Transcript_54675/m.158805 type:complete len:179 (-) Transcript_54675:526-1062(-)